MGYARAAIKCIVNTSSKQSHKATHPGFAVFGILHSQASQPTSQATGEWVGDEKIAERRVATKASKSSQSSPRVFSEIFCSTHPERGARQPTVQVPQSETSASHLCKFPRARKRASQLSKFPERNTSHQIGMHPPTPYPTFSKIYPARRAKCDHALRSMPSSRVSQLVAGNRSSSAVSFKANVPRSTWASTAR